MCREVPTFFSVCSLVKLQYRLEREDQVHWTSGEYYNMKPVTSADILLQCGQRLSYYHYEVLNDAIITGKQAVNA